jgi:hypothetical protein
VHKPCTAHSVWWCVMLCPARVHGMKRPGPACSWWGEGCISNWRGRRSWDDLPATVWWGCRFDKPVRTLAQCTARMQKSCAPLI